MDPPFAPRGPGWGVASAWLAPTAAPPGGIALRRFLVVSADLTATEHWTGQILSGTRGGTGTWLTAVAMRNRRKGVGWVTGRGSVAGSPSLPMAAAGHAPNAPRTETDSAGTYALQRGRSRVLASGLAMVHRGVRSWMSPRAVCSRGTVDAPKKTKLCCQQTIESIVWNI